MEKTPLVSIVVPLYNAIAHVQDCVEGLRGQTLEEIQVLFVDDGSTDGSAEAVEHLTAGDGRFRVIRQENQGPGAARNTGIEVSEGTYIAFVDNDDVPFPNYAKNLLAAAVEHEADVAICQFEELDAQTGQTRRAPERFDAGAYPPAFNPRDFADDLFGSFRNWPWAKLFRRSFLAAENIRFPLLHRTEDLAFTCAALASARCIALVDEELYAYRVGNPKSSTRTRASHPLDFFDSCLALKRHLEDAGRMGTYQATYTQWVGLCCMLNLLELRDVGAYAQVYARLHDGGLAQLGLGRPRTFGEPRGRNSASGAIQDADVEAALSIIERHGNAAGTAALLALAARIKAR